MLGLERAVVLVDDEPADFFREARVASDLGGVAEVLGKDEVQVAFERMAKDDRLGVAVLPQQSLQVQRCGGQRFNRKGNVLGDDGGAGAANGADRGECSFANLPVHLAGGGIGGESGWLDGNDSGQRAQRGIHAFFEKRGRFGAHLDQQGGGFIAQGAQNRRQSGLRPPPVATSTNKDKNQLP